MDYFSLTGKELTISRQQVEAVANLLTDGATVPFIARYRKEAHGSLDEVAITAIRDRLAQLHELNDRRKAMLKSLQERALLAPELENSLTTALSLTELEDIYLPYRPKRRTRAMIAKEKGLEPLAQLILEQKATTNPRDEAAAYLNEENGLATVDDALAGARDIIAEIISEDTGARSTMRSFFQKQALILSRLTPKATKALKQGAKEQAEINFVENAAKFRDYFDWNELASKAAGHRILAMLRGETEGVLSLSFLPDAESALTLLLPLFVHNNSVAASQVTIAIEDGYKRLLAPSMETELRTNCREQAESEAISVFSKNLRELLLTAPLGQKRLLAIDPGFRTGCKVVCLDAQGALLYHDIIYVMSPQQQKDAVVLLQKLYKKYQPEAIAIGNGTAGRETESLVKSLGLSIPVLMVSESGASVYSASEVARREFPDLDLTVRGAVSIGRRLMDPLAELVKVDPKSIGVGQYQHDIDQTRLKQSLNDSVLSCVNAVGVEVNTASAELLAHVSGIGPTLAKAIVTKREENGPYKSRKELLKVPRLGPKAFEQAAGFLRIQGATYPLDSSSVHPEAYALVEAMAKDLGCSLLQLIEQPGLREKLTPARYVTETFGLPTITDILRELEKPGRDPREHFEVFSFNENINSMEDLEPGMRLPGIITNVTNFGAFVDIGVHQDGLVHISQLADRFISDPHAEVKVQQKVMVTVVDVDIRRKRIALTMKNTPDASSSRVSTSTTPHTRQHKEHHPHQNDRSLKKTEYTPFKDLLSKLR